MNATQPTHCPACHAPLMEGAKFCTNCGMEVPVDTGNHCENPMCVRFTTGFSFPPEVMYCDQCGKITTLGKQIEKLL